MVILLALVTHYCFSNPPPFIYFVGYLYLPLFPGSIVVHSLLYLLLLPSVSTNYNSMYLLVGYWYSPIPFVVFSIYHVIVYLLVKYCYTPFFLQLTFVCFYSSVQQWVYDVRYCYSPLFATLLSYVCILAK